MGNADRFLGTAPIETPAPRARQMTRGASYGFASKPALPQSRAKPTENGFPLPVPTQRSHRMALFGCRLHGRGFSFLRLRRRYRAAAGGSGKSSSK